MRKTLLLRIDWRPRFYLTLKWVHDRRWGWFGIGQTTECGHTSIRRFGPFALSVVVLYPRIRS